MSFVLFVFIFVAAVYAGYRVGRAYLNRPRTRVIGPDDDPDFLWRLGRDDNPRTP